MKTYALPMILLMLQTVCYAQFVPLDNTTLTPIKVSMALEKVGKRSVVRVSKDSTVKEIDESTFVRLNNIEFKNGTIEVDVRSTLLPNAIETARGFIGIAFRINGDNSKFECIYIRPTNGRAEDQVRRNHSIQYFSFPDFKFPRLRKEAPEKYESYSDMGLNEWIKLKIEVMGTNAKLFINGNKQPSLVVTDLKHGETSGSIGLFVDVGTDGFFSNVKISKSDSGPKL